MPPPDITLALPCYNERANIAGVLAASAAALDRLGRPWEILVVDNHSSDGTADAVRAVTAADRRVRLVVHESNRFYSGSCRTVLGEARGRLVAIMDSDGQFTAADLPAFVAALDGGANLVMGWRRVRHDPLSRKLMSVVFNRMARHWLRYPLHDLNVGLRMFDRRFVAVASIRHALNLANPELYVSARRAGLTVTEVPVTHAPRTGGTTSHDFRRLFGLFVTLVRYFRDLSRELDAAPPPPPPGGPPDAARSRSLSGSLPP